MAGRDKRRGRDLDDWFDESQPPIARPARPDESRARTDVAQESPASGDDWLGGGDVQPARRPRSRPLGPLSEPRFAIAAVVVVVALVLGLALSGVFSSATPRHAVTNTVPTHARITTAASTATKPTAAPSGPLKPGDRGSEVKVLQRALASLGYSPGAVDGDYGASTQRAVARFQNVSKLTSDGILGPKTLLALRTALKVP